MLQELLTPWGENLSDKPWQVYPRPRMKRDSYVNLNGIWDFAVSDTEPTAFVRTIRVPFCTESALSGVKEHFPEGSGLWYRRRFALPEGFNRGRVLLHIGAADQELKCYVNRMEVGTHRGITAMTFDITDALQDTNELLIRVTDDLRDLSCPYGKQTLNRGGMWYTPVSGIWQTVWLESVPQTYIRNLRVHNRGYTVTIDTGDDLAGTVTVKDLGTFPLVGGKVTISPEKPHLWSPEDPYLYEFTVEAGDDRVESYFAIRSLEIKTVDGTARLCLNGKPYFFHGLLDQGYWPDGLFTPATADCYDWDILSMKKLGFNTLRKHIKVEPEQCYYACDRLGMIVFQDMVNNGDYSFLRDTVVPTFLTQHRKDQKLHMDPATRKAFLAGMEATVRQLKNHPSICYWTIFNEAWGQFDSTAVYHRLKALDSSRFIDTTSGWFRGSESDVESLHIYFNFWHRLRRSKKPIVLSEFGGFTYSAAGHIFNPGKSYGYGTCKDIPQLEEKLRQVYLERVLPAIGKGLCGSIYTQVSDVEDEINGMVTYDRKLVKPGEAVMQDIAARLQEAFKEATT